MFAHSYTTDITGYIGNCYSVSCSSSRLNTSSNTVISHFRCIWQKYHRDYDTGSVLLGEYNSECHQNAKPNESITVDVSILRNLCVVFFILISFLLYFYLQNCDLMLFRRLNGHKFEQES